MQLRDVRCGYCNRLLFKAAGKTAVVEIKCQCKKIVKIAITDGKIKHESLEDRKR